MKKNKVAIFIPADNKNSSKKTGFLSATEVSSLEKKLKSNPEIDYLGNIDFHNINVKNGAFISSSIDLANLDLFCWYAPGMSKHRPILSALANYTKVIKNPISFSTVADKFLSHSLLESKGLPVAEFALISCDDFKKMEEVIATWKTVILKPRKGSFGRGIIKVNDFETLRDIAGMLKAEQKQKNIFVEKFYENDPAEWISTTIINGKVTYGYRKKIEKFAGWKVYDPKAIGGGAFWVDPQPIKKIAEKAALLLDKSVVGFDFIKTNEGYKLIDENNFPGFYSECFKESNTEKDQLFYEMILSHLN